MPVPQRDIGATAIADGVPAVLPRAGRAEQLMLGASQVKVMAGRGVASAYNPSSSASTPKAAASVEIARTVDESTPAWPAPVRAKRGAPNVIFSVLDDVGFGHFGCYDATNTCDARGVVVRGNVDLCADAKPFLDRVAFARPA